MPPADTSAFRGVDSELMSYAPGSLTSPTTYTRPVRSRETETPADVSRYCVPRVLCTSCWTSPRVRPLTSTGPASGNATRPCRSTTRVNRVETPPHNSIARPSVRNVNLSARRGIPVNQSVAEFHSSKALERINRTRMEYRRTESDDAQCPEAGAEP